MEKPESPKKYPVNDPRFLLKQCFTLSNIAMELDAMYRATKQVVHVSRVEDAYLKALKCFIESYETKKEDALTQINKMSYLLLAIESERQKDDPSYRMPPEIADVYKKGLALRISNKKKLALDQFKSAQKTSGETQFLEGDESFNKLIKLHEAMNQLTYTTPRLSHTDDDEIYKYLKSEMPKRARASSMIDANHFAIHQGEQLCLKAHRMLPAHFIDNDEIYLAIEDTYIQAIRIFADAYKQRSYSAFGNIHNTLEYLLTIQKIRQSLKGSHYKVSKQCTELYDQLVLIKEQEKARIQKDKKTILARNDQKK